MEVRVRNVDDWVVAWHRHQAKMDGRSLESELRQVITDAALARKRQIADEMRAGLAELAARGGVFTDSAKIIREDRDHRG